MLNRSYADDIFVLFFSPDHANNFKEYLSHKHMNISFFYRKREKVVVLTFLNVHSFVITR